MNMGASGFFWRNFATWQQRKYKYKGFFWTIMAQHRHITRIYLFFEMAIFKK
jgi:hypothetical protein